MKRTNPPGGPTADQRGDQRGDEWGGLRADPRPSFPSPRARTGRTVVWLGVLAVVLTGVAADAVVLGRPLDFAVARMAAAVKTRTGRDLSVGGGTTVSFFPQPRIVMRDVTIAATAGPDGRPTVRIGMLEAGLSFWPLLRRDVEITTLIARDADVELSIDREGRRSWAIAKEGVPDAAAGQPSRLPAIGQPAGAAAEPSQAPNWTGAIANVAFDHVAVENGTVRFHDERTGRAFEIGAVDATLRLASLETPLEAEGRFVAGGAQNAFTARVATLRQLLMAEPADLALAVSAPDGHIHFVGALVARSQLDVSGRFEVSGASARTLAARLGYSLPDGAGPLGAFALQSGVRWHDGTLALSDLAATLDGSTANGALTLATAGPRPRLTGAVQVSQLVLYGSEVGGPTAKTGAAPPPPAAPAPAPARVVPQVKGYRARDGWSETPLALGALKSVDAAVHLGVKGARVGAVTLGPMQLELALENGRLGVTVEDAALYDGHGKGTIVVDATGSQTLVGANLTGDGVAIEPLLNDASGFDWLAGHGRVAIQLTGKGNSERAIIETLAGTALLTARDGAVVGFDVPKRLAALNQGRIPDLNRIPTERTPLTELGASFKVAGGIAETNDIKVTGQGFELAGAGRISLPQRTLDVTVNPKLTSASVAGLVIPVRIEGPWDATSMHADIGGALKSPALQAIMKDPAKAAAAAKDALKKLDGDTAGGAVAKAKDLIGKFLKQH